MSIVAKGCVSHKGISTSISKNAAVGCWLVEMKLCISFPNQRCVLVQKVGHACLCCCLGRGAAFLCVLEGANLCP